LIVLEVLAVKAVHRLDTGKAIGAVLLPALVIFLIVCCCVVIGASVLLPMMGETFQLCKCNCWVVFAPEIERIIEEMMRGF
jgi:DNA integrity scanning protein DisA with diadenylate cyclase activity